LIGHNDTVSCLAQLKWDKNDFTIISGSTDKTIKIWDVIEGSVLTTLYGHTNLITSLVYLNNSYDDTRFASSSLNEIRLWRKNQK
jgi:WD40 repeat protein